jgi:hypothetical protein
VFWLDVSIEQVTDRKIKAYIDHQLSNRRESKTINFRLGSIRRCFVPRPKVKDYAELNEWLKERCLQWAGSHPHPSLALQSVWQVLVLRAASRFTCGTDFAVRCKR